MATPKVAPSDMSEPHFPYKNFCNTTPHICVNCLLKLRYGNQRKGLIKKMMAKNIYIYMPFFNIVVLRFSREILTILTQPFYFFIQNLINLLSHIITNVIIEVVLKKKGTT